MLTKWNAIVWGPPGLLLLLGCGVWLTIRTGFAQFRLLVPGLKAFAHQLDGNDRSGFRPLCTALAATVGTGNIAGVAGAIALGGPGALFWMWISGLIGMATKYAEALLAVRYAENQTGGPMYVITRGLSKPWHPLAWVYSFFGIVAALGVGNATQINAVVSAVRDASSQFGHSMGKGSILILGMVMALLVWRMVSGGHSRIGAAAEILVPFASLVYIGLCAAVLILRFTYLDDAFAMIIKGAFTIPGVLGGAAGSGFLALRYGVSRGVFSNEAGMGTAGIAHAGANVDHPAQQGMMGIVEVFLDTILLCTLTGLVILVSGVSIPYGTGAGAELTSGAMTGVLGSWVSVVLSLCLACFAFATILGWGLYAGRCIEFIFGKLNWKLFAMVQAVAVFLGTILDSGMIWGFSELMNGLMAVPNLIALLLLSNEVRQLTLEFLE